jgi:TetR/AcrR family transcriptional regulator, regulator of cefoperazone and chloramphenicol sensitivity
MDQVKASPVVSFSAADGGVSTRSRLLEAAGEVFAEKGFRSATVRDICARAGANIAAINYYFQGKDSLYLHVVEYAQERALEARPIIVDAGAEPREQLRQFLASFVARVLDPAGPAWHSKLMLREMVEPTPALDRVVASSIRPTFEALTGIITKIAPGLTEHEARLCASSVLGQCLVHRHCQPVMERVFPEQRCTGECLARLADHVYHFSLAGLLAMNAEAGRKGRAR